MRYRGSRHEQIEMLILLSVAAAEARDLWADLKPRVRRAA